MDKKREVFGKKISRNFKIGDLVRWNKLGSEKGEEMGVIIDLFDKEIGGRLVYCAKIVKLGEKMPVIVPALTLKMVSESKIDEIQNN